MNLGSKFKKAEWLPPVEMGVLQLSEADAATKQLLKERKNPATKPKRNNNRKKH